MPTLQSIPLNVTALGSHTVIAGNADTPTIQIVALYFQCAVGTTLVVKAGTAALTGSMSFISGNGLNLPNNGTVYYECDNGSDFVMDLTGLTGSLGGALMYYQF